MPEIPEQLDRLRAALGDRYDVDRRIGRGGMATVYLAVDRKLGRQVAIKVLRPDVTAAVDAERFMREIDVTARMQHPHIVPVIEAGQIDGILFCVLPYVDGQSLRELLDRTRQLEVADAIRTTLQIADALAYAHGRGIIHRDIKPENILLSAGHAMVTDFGLAKAIAGEGVRRLTDSGIALGTPWYMSPEQGAGDLQIDARADLYSLACVLYEMLAGEPPFTGATPQMVVARHVSQPPPPLRVVRPGVRDAITRVIERAMAKSPADRYASVAEFAAALQKGAADGGDSGRWPRRGARIFAIAAGVAAIVGVGALARGVLRARTLALNPAHIAVLSIRAVNASSSVATFAAALTERLTDALSVVDGLAVTSRAGVATFERRNTSIDSIARALKVGTLVDGDIVSDGTQLQITLQLMDSTGNQLSTAQFTGAFPDRIPFVNAVADTVARLLRQALGVTIRLRQQQLSARNPEAFDLLHEGQTELKMLMPQLETGDFGGAHRTLDAVDSMFAAAARADRAWVEPVVARAMLAESRFMLASLQREADPQRLLAPGLELASEALRIKPNDPSASQARGYLRYSLWQTGTAGDSSTAAALLRSAESDLQRAIAGNPDRSTVLRTLSEVELALGRPGEAIRLAEGAYASDPFLANSDVLVFRLYQYYLEQGNDSLAAARCDDGFARFTRNPIFYTCQLELLAWSKAKRPDPAAAHALMVGALAVTPGAQRDILGPSLDALVGVVDARAGRRDSAETVLHRIQRAGEGRQAAVSQAVILAFLGQPDSGGRVLRSYALRHPDERMALLGSPGVRFFIGTPAYQSLTTFIR